MPYKDPEKQRAYRKHWYRQNREEILAQQKRARVEDPQKKQAIKRKSDQKNKERVSRWFRERRRVDPQYRLRLALRSRLHQALRGQQRRGSAVRDLGVSVPEFKEYIEAQFQPGMTWENWSRDGWHLDHIKPLASFDLTDRDQLLEACHYMNLRSMWAEENLRRGRR